MSEFGASTHAESHAMPWDIFISYASEDREEVARPLANELQKAELKVWFDQFELGLGDSLRHKIDVGLAQSNYPMACA
jgi:TIR domain